MDGNGRWANKRHLPRIAGHRAGLQAVRKIVAQCAELGIEALTLFAFSSENWRRPRKEVNLLMELFSQALLNEVKKLNENKVRLRVIGSRQRFSEKIKRYINHAEELTQQNTGLNLVIAADYGGHWDIVNAAKNLAQRVADGTLSIEQIDEELFQSNLCLSELPEPDLFIRSGGEKRVSNFLLWQLAYTELYFTDVLWPDFDEHAFIQSLESFAGRQRRFGRTGEQVGQVQGA